MPVSSRHVIGVCMSVAVLGLLGCSSTTVIDDERLREFIETDLSDQLGYPITEVDCPRIEDPEPEQAFECTGVVDGQTVRFAGRVDDAEDGTVWVENADAILPVGDLETVITDDFSALLDLSLAVDCGDSEVIVEAPSAVFRCDIEFPDSGESGTVRVEVVDAEGNVTYEIE